MLNFDELRTQAESLGLSGSDVAQFVIRQQTFEREERVTEREREREERGREKREKERQFELAKLQLTQQSGGAQSQDHLVSRPSLHAYHEGEDIASYLTRFERIADLLQLKEDSLAVWLGSLLTGDAAELYSTFDSDTIGNFLLLKQALLTGFSKTPEHYRLDFRNNKIWIGENYRQFSTRLQQLLDSWLEASQVSKSVQPLREFMVLDQFLSSLHPDIRLFIKEQQVTNLKTAVEKADAWASAHNAYPQYPPTGSGGRRHDGGAAVLVVAVWGGGGGARVLEAAAAAAAGGGWGGQCQVLPPNLPPTTYPLPTSLTLKPTASEWRLDFTLKEAEASPACVRVEPKQQKLRLLLYRGDCDHGELMDYTLTELRVPPHAWTSLGVAVRDNLVVMTRTTAAPITLKPDSFSLLGHALSVAAAQGVEAAVGCRGSCPSYHHASRSTDTRMTVMTPSEEKVSFYFLPGATFVRLEYEVCCITPLGPEAYPFIADIEVPELSRGQWHLVTLHQLGDAIEVSLDNRFLRQGKLPSGCTFKNHAVKVIGDTLLRFCNTATGAEWEGVNSSQPAPSNPCPLVVAGVAGVLVVVAVVVVGVTVRRMVAAERVVAAR
ncbi:hypothetical protein GWK47_018185 [Chionoecetes opilio]|uniref:SCAN box domain-containing protein n=1 Tax=Chionoecetes opilio TaxID=41210 RepID=A0A8J4XS06_CHIOP|nr:hypothetical protein GWK47_018185 [Chionoecetes opilio]